jgi:hypothetical protein
MFGALYAVNTTPLSLPRMLSDSQFFFRTWRLLGTHEADYMVKESLPLHFTFGSASAFMTKWAIELFKKSMTCVSSLGAGLHPISI